jgi:hypothetical protein
MFLVRAFLLVSSLFREEKNVMERGEYSTAAVEVFRCCESDVGVENNIVLLVACVRSTWVKPCLC